MIALLLGGFVLLLFLGGLRGFANASVTTVKSFLAWTAALAGLSLALLLILTGREAIGFIALGLALPLARQLWAEWKARRWSQAASAAPGSNSGANTGAGARTGSRMSVEEAWDVLGLRPGASAEEIRAAHRRLMQAAHPDKGGSDWIAARVNQARDVLLKQKQRSPS